MARRHDIINYFLSEIGLPTRYLEIGAGSGVCGEKVYATEKWGVDPVAKGDRDRHARDVYAKLFVQESDDFFKELASTEKFDVIFVDGLHLKEQVYKDVLNGLKHLTDRGVIVMHDCNPGDEATQAVPRTQNHWNGDVWKAMVRLRSEHPELFCRVVMEDEGVGVVIPRPLGKEKRDVTGLRCPAFELQYKDLIADRAGLLGHVSMNDVPNLKKEAAATAE